MGVPFYSVSHRVRELRALLRDDTLFYKALAIGVYTASSDYAPTRRSKGQRAKLEQLIDISTDLGELVDTLNTLGDPQEYLSTQVPSLTERMKKDVASDEKKLQSKPLLKLVLDYLQVQNGLPKQKLERLGQAVYSSILAVKPFYNEQNEGAEVGSKLLISHERAPSLNAMGRYLMDILRKESDSLVTTLSKYRA